jgi:WhiB family transcriptional regulator, redox-sensing transcriptional regulator
VLGPLRALHPIGIPALVVVVRAVARSLARGVIRRGGRRSSVRPGGGSFGNDTRRPVTDLLPEEFAALAAGHDVPLDLAEIGWHRPDWQDEALCRDTGTHHWFPTERDDVLSSDDPKWLRARAWCARCPVKVECLEWALIVDVRYGMWGGTTPKERRVIRRQRKRAA